jgi:formylglycine-generating enzyme required for sulfatase activity
LHSEHITMRRVQWVAGAVAFAATLLQMQGTATAATINFGSGANQFGMAFVAIGEAGNPADTAGTPSPAGSVPYPYQIGKYEVSRDQVAKANAAGSLGISLDSMSVVTGGARTNMPATGISWNEAARFVNWLNTSQGHPAAYKFADQPGDAGYNANANVLLWDPSDAGYNAANPFRNTNAYYFLPNADEWYKAAYYNPTGGNYFLYPTGSNTAPTPVTNGTLNNTAVYSLLTKNGPADIDNAGGPSVYGTYAQGGNVYEWDETDVDLVNDDPDAARGVRGGRWSFSTDYNLSSVNRYADSPALEAGNVGFRVAAVPEPSSGLLALTGLLALLRRRR